MNPGTVTAGIVMVDLTSLTDGAVILEEMVTIILPMQGGCVCGKVRYEVRGHPLMMIVCHCHDCQRRTGSAFSMNLIVKRSDFILKRGRIVTRDLPGAQSKISVQHFCHHCLARTHSDPMISPPLIYVRPGTLDNPLQVSPIAQIWAQSARSSAIVGDIRTFEQDVDERQLPALIREWREAHPI